MRLFISFLITAYASAAMAQIPKKTILEHFTNSSCSICANNNPNIITTLQNNPNVLHISFYPSSPYANCFFSMQNPVENDARTNFYGIYGGTPKLILNGELTPLANLQTAISGVSADSSNFDLKAYQQYVTADSVVVTVIIKKVANDTLSEAVLFVGSAEDTVMQTTNNGESIHHDVFRKALTQATGDTLTMPVNVHDSITQTFMYKIQPNWVTNRMKTLSILQHSSTKKVINATLSENIPNTPLSLYQNDIVVELVYPNPANSILIINDEFIGGEVTLWSLEGRKVLTEKTRSNKISIASITSGTYFMQLTKGNKIQYHKIIIDKN